MSKPWLRLRVARGRGLLAAGLLAGALALVPGAVIAPAQANSQSEAPAAACTLTVGRLCATFPGRTAPPCLVGCSAPTPGATSSPQSCLVDLVGLCAGTSSGSTSGGSTGGSGSSCQLACIGSQSCAVGAVGSCLVGGATGPLLPPLPVGSAPPASGAPSAATDVPQVAPGPPADTILSVTGSPGTDRSVTPARPFDQGFGAGGGDGGAVPVIDQFGPASGLSFGRGLNLWVLFLILDVLAAACAVRVVRRSWKASGQD